MAGLVSGVVPLPTAARSALERNYGVDLGRVRVHTGAEASAASRSHGTVALTRGDDIYVGEAAARDPLVIGHELVHAVQQAHHDTGGAEADLEAEASSVSEGATEAITGGAAFGTVQTWWPFDDDDEERARAQQRSDADAEPLVKKLNILGSTEEWKKHIDNPVVAGWLKAHPGRLDPRGEDKEFQRWLANPKDRPSGATATPQASPQVAIKEATDLPPKAAKQTESEKGVVERVRSTWDPVKKGDFAQFQREEKWRRYVASKAPEKGSFDEAAQTLGEMTGLSSIKRAVTGRNYLDQKLSWDDRIGEAILGPAKLVETAGTIALGLPEFGPVGAVAPELLGAEEGLAALAPEALEGAELAEGTELVNAGAEFDEAAQVAKRGYQAGEDVGAPLGWGGEPPQATPPGGFVASGAPETQAGELQVTPQTAPQYVPESTVTATPQKPPQPLQIPSEYLGEAEAGETGWSEAELEATKGELGAEPMKDVAIGPEKVAKTPPVKPPPNYAAARAAVRKIARPGAAAIPLIDQEPRLFPPAEKRPPITEKETPPPLIIDPENHDEEAQFPSERKPEDFPLPNEEQDKGPMIAAPTGKKQKKSKLDKEIDEAFKEDPTGPDIAPDKSKQGLRKIPEAEEIQPQSRETELSTKKREELLADYQRIANREIPKIVEDILKEQELTPTRERLAELKDEFEKLMRKVGNRRELTPAQRKEAEAILEEARVLARNDFGNLQKSVWLPLRQHPELAKIEQQLRKAGDVGPGGRALQVPARKIGESETEFESLGLEHRTRLSDDPFLYNDPLNLIVTDAAQNEQYLEAIRRYGIWPTGKTEEFVVRHGLSSQPYDFAPGSRPIGKKPGP